METKEAAAAQGIAEHNPKLQARAGRVKSEKSNDHYICERL